MVKQLLTWIACSLVLVACNDSSSSKVPEPEPEPVPGIETPKYLRSYVCYYMDGEWGGSGVRDCRLVLKDEGLKVYASADITGRPDEKAAEFQRLAERNGDVSYNRSEIPLSYNHRSSYVHNLRAIHAVCTSGDWDADHAKGESLDDCIQADFLSYGKYVDSGYTLQDNVEWVKKPLSELNEKDMKMINPDYTGITLNFDPMPAPGEYTLRVTLVTTENEEIVIENVSVSI